MLQWNSRGFALVGLALVVIAALAGYAGVDATNSWSW